jgi:5'-3' exonuclease
MIDLPPKMGITGFSDFAKLFKERLTDEAIDQIWKDINLYELKNAHIVIDGNALLIRYGSVFKTDDIRERNGLTLSAILAVLRRLIDNGCTLCMVTDIRQIVPPNEFSQAIDRRIKNFRAVNGHLFELGHTIDKHSVVGEDESLLSNKPSITENTVVNAKAKERSERLEQQKKYNEENAVPLMRVTNDLIDLLELCCSAMNISFHRCVIEADGLMAGIAERWSRQKKDVYLIVEDTDLFAYKLGNTKILRKNSIHGRLSGSLYERVDVQKFWETLGINSPMVRYRIPLLMKCDYFKAIKGIGPVRIMSKLTINCDGFPKPKKLADGSREELNRRDRLYPTNSTLNKFRDHVDATNSNYKGSDLIDKVLILKSEKYLEKIGISRDFLKENTMDDLSTMINSKYIIERSISDIDEQATKKLKPEDFSEYVSALFRFVEGPKLEMDFLRVKSKKPNKKDLETVVIGTTDTLDILTYVYPPSMDESLDSILD